MFRALGRQAYRFAAAALGVYQRVVPAGMRGVRCVLLHGDDVLLVRHTYGASGWLLPGGLVGRRERPAAAARREVEEELGLSATDWRGVGWSTTRSGRSRNVTFLYVARASSREVDEQELEIEESAWFRHDALPDGTPRETRMLVTEGLKRYRRRGRVRSAS